MLLVLVVKQADVHAKEKTDQQAAKIAAEKAKLEAEREQEDFRQEMLHKMRPKVTEKLAERRVELGYLEQNVPDLREEAVAVQ